MDRQTEAIMLRLYYVIERGACGQIVIKMAHRKRHNRSVSND